MSHKVLVSVNFEVFGKVQGVFFRKYTEKEAIRLSLFGWVMNTEYGTVKGQLQGIDESVKKMKDWLKKSGSPKSRIDKVVFNMEKEMTEFEFNSFEIRK